jgi:hypothetical protein
MEPSKRIEIVLEAFVFEDPTKFWPSKNCICVVTLSNFVRKKPYLRFEVVLWSKILYVALVGCPGFVRKLNDVDSENPAAEILIGTEFTKNNPLDEGVKRYVVELCCDNEPLDGVRNGIKLGDGDPVEPVAPVCPVGPVLPEGPVGPVETGPNANSPRPPWVISVCPSGTTILVFGFTPKTFRIVR